MNTIKVQKKKKDKKSLQVESNLITRFKMYALAHQATAVNKLQKITEI